MRASVVARALSRVGVQVGLSLSLPPSLSPSPSPSLSILVVFSLFSFLPFLCTPASIFLPLIPDVLVPISSLITPAGQIVLSALISYRQLTMRICLFCVCVIRVMSEKLPHSRAAFVFRKQYKEEVCVKDNAFISTVRYCTLEHIDHL